MPASVIEFLILWASFGDVVNSKAPEAIAPKGSIPIAWQIRPDNDDTGTVEGSIHNDCWLASDSSQSAVYSPP